MIEFKYIMSFIVFVWGQNIESSLHKELEQFQRLGLLQLGHFRKGTLSAGLEIIFGVPPLQYYLQGEIIKAYVRLKYKLKMKWDGIPFFGTQISHIK